MRSDQNWPVLALSNQRHYLSEIKKMDNHLCGVWIIDAGAQTTYANERMAELLGTSPSEMSWQPSFAYLFPADVEAAQHLFDEKKDGSPNPFRFRLRKKDGSALLVDVQGTPMHDTAGVFTGIVGTFSLSK
jgi:PAS domain S-box-containing protein